MKLEELKELNEKVLKKAFNRVNKAAEMDTYDKESFEALSMAIKNTSDISKIEKYSDLGDKSREELLKSRVNPKEGTTEFEALIYEIAEKKPTQETMLAITTVMAETMEDLRILHPRMYNLSMNRLKELLE